MKAIINVRILTAVTLIFFFARSLTAQTYVTIPDANFVTYLQTHYPACMNGNQMDITCADITNEHNLDVSGKNIASIEGVQHFSSLFTLCCSSNPITSLPTLPASLQELKLYGCQVTVLPTLPSGLKRLDCSFNQLTAIPDLPAGLVYLNLDNNIVSSFPATLPVGLYEFDCFNNQLTSIPELPDGLVYFSCGYNLLTVIPNLPPNLNQFVCTNNQVATIPALPQTLDVFWCENNLLTSLPTLTPAITDIRCSGNNLGSIGPLPNGILTLYCMNCQLTSLPELPNSLGTLYCQDNNISCFPKFPPYLFEINIDNNPNTCVPNYAPGMTVFPPLCRENEAVNNPNNCLSFTGIAGSIFADNNTNCIADAGDNYVINIPLKLYNDQDELIAQIPSFNFYEFTQEMGSYRVEVDTADQPFQILCNVPGVDSLVVLDAAHPLAEGVDFYVNCKPGFDLGCRSVLTIGETFPGKEHAIDISAGDMLQWYNMNCLSAGLAGTVTVTVTGPVTYQHEATGALVPTSVSGNTLTYSISDFSTIATRTAFGLVFLTNTTAQEHDAICINVTVEASQSGDVNLENNTFQFCYEVINSHDPNKKEVSPVNVLPGYDGYFTYTIHFQNTGSAPAHDISLTDTLDPNLDKETFALINYSHVNEAILRGDVLTFNFKNIMLPDSTTDLAGSQGFVQYRIRAKPNLPLGTQIKNTAYIFFDFNDAVVTNTTVNEYVTQVGLTENKLSDIQVYPNPGKGHYSIRLPETVSASSIEVFNLVGERVITTVSQPGIIQLDLGNHPNGVYILKIDSPEGNFTTRLIKQ